MAEGSLLFTRNARSRHGVYSPLLEKGLAHACLALPPMPDGLSCNPALNGLEQSARLSFLGNLSNGYSNLMAFRELSEGSLSTDLTDRIFRDNEPLLQVESNAQVVFVSTALSIRFVPFDLNSYVVARNEANPLIEVGHVQSHFGEVQASYRVVPDLDVGLRISGGTREWTYRQFRLLSPDLPKPTMSWFLRAEPGAAYVFRNLPWTPRIGVVVAGLGYDKAPSDLILSGIDPQLGISVAPPVPWGKLWLSFDWRRLQNNAALYERPHFGVAYALGSLTTTAGMDADGLSIGFLTQLGNLNAGILFTSTRAPLFGSADFYTETLHLEAGWTF